MVVVDVDAVAEARAQEEQEEQQEEEGVGANNDPAMEEEDTEVVKEPEAPVSDPNPELTDNKPTEEETDGVEAAPVVEEKPAPAEEVAADVEPQKEPDLEMVRYGMDGSPLDDDF